MHPALDIKDLHKTYKSGTHALKGIDLEVHQGEFFGLLGPNGSGKTTMINCISGPTKKSSGTIKVQRKDIDRYRQETKMMLGVVPQEIVFDSFFTVNEVMNIQSGYYGIKNNQAHIDDVLEKLDLQEKKKTNTRALSGGMKRRLLVAKALVHQPKLLILDEPTAGVDIELRHNLWKYMRQLNKDGLTILLTTHYLEEAESLCKRIAILNKGKVVALDNTKKLIKSMGDSKKLTLTFADRIHKIPEKLQPYSPEKSNHHQIAIHFETSQLDEILTALQNFKPTITDIDIEGRHLEDVFVELTYRNNG